MINLKTLSLSELEYFIEEFGSQKYRAAQIFKWLYQKRVNSIDEMTNISKKMREKLTKIAFVDNLEIKKIEIDKVDFTQKLLIKLYDDNYIETVIIFDEDRVTLCISSQVGCNMGCEFCTTAKAIDFKRNLNSFEIIEQVIIASKILEKENKKVTNVVFMGMGEPLKNYDNVIKVCDILKAEHGFGLGIKRITISTSGLVPEIKKIADYKNKYQLAISLNATNDKLRNTIMPINKKYNLAALLSSVKYYNSKRKARYPITFEYVLLKDINDTDVCLKELILICKKLNCKVNLINFNSTEFVDFKPTTEDRIDYFFKILNRNKIRTMIRKSKGQNISGACGQLCGKIK